MRIIKTIMVFGCLLLVTGCDSGSGVIGGSSTLVSYSVDCDTGVTCNNASDRAEIKIGDDRSINCIWHCASYKGQPNVYVSLTLIENEKNKESCWDFDKEYITDGICSGFSAKPTE
ncbi:MAG: hypothetical protein KAI39_08635 [Desulfobulbaceae bacterium]|nr:hypothetical protein [Desulfobulbaceae bacterium]